MRHAAITVYFQISDSAIHSAATSLSPNAPAPKSMPIGFRPLLTPIRTRNSTQNSRPHTVSTRP
jgi:hypothetical protein